MDERLLRPGPWFHTVYFISF